MARRFENGQSPIAGLLERAERCNQTNEHIRDKIRSCLLHLHQRFVEEGAPNHIITCKDLATALNMPSKQIQNLIQRGYTRSTGLSDVLEALGLPHKKRTDRS